MRKTMKLALVMLVAGVTAMVPGSTKAQRPDGWGPGGRHPEYMHALSDLRAARHYLADGWAWGPVRHDDDAAIREIDAAINEIKMAAIDDGHGINDPFPIDTSLSPHDRFRKANELLFKAHQDLNGAREWPEARGLRDRAWMHIDRAHQIVDNAWRTAHWQ